MMEDENQELVFKGLAHGTRRKILDLLKDKARTTGDLCDQFPELSRCTVMQHLGVLEKAGLVMVRREGRQRWNYLNIHPIQEIYDRWISRYASASTALLNRLKKELEE